MKLIDCEQGSEEWKAARLGVVTASIFDDACSYQEGRTLKSGIVKEGKYSQTQHNRAFEVAWGLVYKTEVQPDIETFAMRRGKELEECARALHAEKLRFQTLQQVGFIVSDCGRFGCSPDGLIDDDGGVEYKAFYQSSLLDRIFSGDRSDVMYQVQGCMWITGRKWWKLGLYHEGMKPEPIRIFDIPRDDAFIEKMVNDLELFWNLVQSKVKNLGVNL